MKKTTAIGMLAVLFVFSALPVFALDTGINYGTALGLGTKDVRGDGRCLIQTCVLPNTPGIAATSKYGRV